MTFRERGISERGIRPSLEQEMAWELDGVLKRMEVVSQHLEQVDTHKLAPPRKDRLVMVSARLARHVRMLALALGLSGGAYTTYKGMETLANAMADRIQDGLDALRQSGLSHRQPEQDLNVDLVVRPPMEAQNRDPDHQGLPMGEASPMTTDDISNASIDRDSELDENVRFLEQMEADRLAGEGLANQFWNRAEFRALTSAEEVARYVGAQVEQMCSQEDADAGDTCVPFRIREAVQDRLQTLSRRALEEHSRSPEELLRVARGLNLANGTGAKNELDLALASGRADLVQDVLGGTVRSAIMTNDQAPAINYFDGRSLTALENLSRVYRFLPANQREALRDRIMDDAIYFQDRSIQMPTEFRRMERVMARMGMEMPRGGHEEDDA